MVLSLEFLPMLMLIKGILEQIAQQDWHENQQQRNPEKC